MKRSKASVLGLTALALLATTALVVSGAQGDPTDTTHEAKITHHFNCLQSDHETLEPECTGHGEEAKVHRPHPSNTFPNRHEFTTTLFAMSCQEVTFTVAEDADGTSATAPTTPHYSGCTIPGKPAEVNVNGCEYEFNIEETIETESPPAGYEETEGKGSAEIKCPEGEAITVTYEGFMAKTKCHIAIKPQKTITPIYFRNKASGTTDLTVEAATATVLANITGGVLNCGGNGNVHTTYTGNTTVVGQVSNGAGGHTQVNARFDDGKTHE